MWPIDRKSNGQLPWGVQNLMFNNNPTQEKQLKMRKIQLAVAIVAVLFATTRQVQAGMIVVDFSPETTGATVGQANLSNRFGSGMLGDRFTLATDTTITGGSIFAGQSGVLGNSVRFLVFEDISGTPSTTPIVNISTTIDVVDTMFAGNLLRKHATIAPTLLAAGTYWFSMPGDGPFLFAQATTVSGSGGYDDGSLRFGTTNLSGGSSSTGDMFFQLEGSSVSSAVPEPSSLALFGIGAIGMAFVAARRRREKQTVAV